ncbi:MAG: Lrp/AsnC family transcriptional regulator [Ramlibacter sp.]
MAAVPLHDATLALLNDFQHDFPLVARPFAALAARVNLTEDAVLARLRDCRAQGSLSRIGAVWGRGAGGAAALCALAVPPGRLEAVADIVSREPAVNHNYEREHAWNLWYVLTGPDAPAVRAIADRLAREAQVPALFLPMVRAYRVDLGFDLRATHAHARAAAAPLEGPAVTCAERPLAVLAEQGLALVPRPFDLWAAELGWPREAVLATLRRWKRAGTLRRFGVVVRHHDLGFGANAMTVLQAPPSESDALGAALARQPGVTLAYQRLPDPRWPYNLYFMVHGRERAAVDALVAAALAGSGAAGLPRATLFSARRFKQTGGRYFAPATEVSP